jgi:cytoskeletal protein CcmA (bactofilin family)
MSNRFYSKKAGKSNDDDDLVQKQLSALGDFSEDTENVEPTIEEAPVAYVPSQPDIQPGEKSIIQKGVVIEGSIKSTSALSILGTINGNVVCESEVTINGNITGDVKASDLQLISGQINGNIECKNIITINKNSSVKGNIDGKSLNCNGRIDGNIKLSGSVALKENSVVIGDISSKKISMTEGAVCRGKLQIDFIDSQNENNLAFANASTANNNVTTDSDANFDKLAKTVNLRQFI